MREVVSSVAKAGRVEEGSPGTVIFRSQVADDDALYLDQQINLLQRYCESRGNPIRRVALAMHTQYLGAFAEVQSGSGNRRWTHRREWL